MTRFGVYDPMARLALLGTAASALAFLLPLPWITARLQLQTVPFTGPGLAVAPALLDRIGTPGAGPAATLVAIAAGVALVAALAGLILAAMPGLRYASELNPRVGQRLAIAGFLGALVAVLAMAAWVGPQVGVVAVDLGAFLGLAGFALAATAWPKAQPLGDAGIPEPPPPALPADAKA